MELKKWRKKIKKQTVMGEIRDLRQKKLKRKEKRYLKTRKKTETEKKAVKQSGYPWNQSENNGLERSAVWY